MTVKSLPDVFVDLRSASVRTARNYHRLEHLGRRGSHTFYEETITDLLLAEMAGLDYVVDGACPLSVAVGPCPDWDGSPSPATKGLHVRALTKREEGGNSRSGARGVHADFVIAVDQQPADQAIPDAPQLRMLIQAKRIAPTQTFLAKATEQKQYNRLVAAAATLGAVPFYALYVQQPDAHTSAATRCPHHNSAADRAIVLIAAHPTGTAGYLPGQSATTVLSRGRPLRCLAGCACAGSRPADPVRHAVAAFIRADFPAYAGASQATPLPRGLRRVRINGAITKMTSRPVSNRLDGASRLSVLRDQLLVVRLGKPTASSDPGRSLIGYTHQMTDAELRESARRYWRLSPTRAERLAFLIAASDGQPLQAYHVLPDGVTYTQDARQQRRAALDIVEVGDARLREMLFARAAEALTELARGSQNPVRYVDLTGFDYPVEEHVSRTATGSAGAG